MISVYLLFDLYTLWMKSYVPCFNYNQKKNTYFLVFTAILSSCNFASEILELKQCYENAKLLKTDFLHGIAFPICNVSCR